MYERWLVSRRGAGDNVVLFMAGGTGSGKSTVAEAQEGAAITVDSTLSSYEWARQQIDMALEEGYDVEIAYVYRDPVEAWKSGIWPRWEAGGHFVAADLFLRTQEAARENLLRIAGEYGDKVRVQVWENRTGQPAREISLDELAGKTYDVAEVREQINAISAEKVKQHPGLAGKPAVFGVPGDSGGGQGSPRRGEPPVEREAQQPQQGGREAVSEPGPVESAAPVAAEGEERGQDARATRIGTENAERGQDARDTKIADLRAKIQAKEAESPTEGVRRRLLAETRGRMREHPLYTQAMADLGVMEEEVASGGTYYVGPKLRGDVEAITGKPGSRGFDRKLHGMFEFEEGGGIPIGAAEIETLIPEAVGNFDSVAARQTAERQEALEFTKRINGASVVVTVIGDQKKRLSVKTMWITKGRSLDAAKGGPAAYARDVTGPTDTIRQNPTEATEKIEEGERGQDARDTGISIEKPPVEDEGKAAVIADLRARIRAKEAGGPIQGDLHAEIDKRFEDSRADGGIPVGRRNQLINETRQAILADDVYKVYAEGWEESQADMGDVDTGTESNRTLPPARYTVAKTKAEIPGEISHYIDGPGGKRPFSIAPTLVPTCI